MRHYDGSFNGERARARMQRDGYICAFENSYHSDNVPPVVKAAPERDGWAIRRAIKKWAKAEGYTDVIPFRATDYLPDLHGSFVYEAWVPLNEWQAKKGICHD
jgi:hypothetical protein